MVVLQEPVNELPRLGSFPRSHLQEKVWETENENNPLTKKNHCVNWETFSEPYKDSLEDSGKGKEWSLFRLDRFGFFSNQNGCCIILKIENAISFL